MAYLWKPRDKKILQHWIDIVMDEGGVNLDDWEYTFIESIDARLQYDSLTESQENKLEEMYIRLTS